MTTTSVQRLFTVGSVLLLAVALVTAVPAGASEEPEAAHEHDEPTYQTAEEGELADLTNVADARGLSVAEIRRQQNAADALGKLQERILKAPGLAENFAGAAIEDNGDAMLYLKGRSSKKMRDAIAESGMDLTIVEGGKYNAAQMQRRSDAVHQQLNDAGFTEIMTTYDMTTGNVEAMVSTLEYRGKRTLPARAADAARVVRSQLTGDLRTDLKLEVVDTTVGEDFSHAAVGGMAAFDDGTFECTIGWPVREISSGRTGITTAGHCSGINQAWDNGAGFGRVNLSHVREHRGEWGDIEWKTTSGTVRAQFVADQNNNVRNVESVEPISNLVVGERICFYGQSSNRRDCDFRVERVSVSCTISNVPNSRLVRMDSMNTNIGGDSGAGWSWNTRAYGSGKGICASKNVFSAADYYDEAIGVRVLTN